MNGEEKSYFDVRGEYLTQKFLKYLNSTERAEEEYVSYGFSFIFTIYGHDLVLLENEEVKLLEFNNSNNHLTVSLASEGPVLTTNSGTKFLVKFAFFKINVLYRKTSDRERKVLEKLTIVVSLLWKLFYR